VSVEAVEVYRKRLGETSAPRTAPEWDAITLERAAEVLKARTAKPGNFWLGLFCRVLTGTARKIRAEADRAAA
jgi:hypothetical protein